MKLKVIESEKTVVTNHYLCPCGEEWQDTWDCGCNDHCPACDKEIEPYASDDGSMTPETIEAARQTAIVNQGLTEELEKAEALGFDSIGAMRDHSAWIDANKKQHADAKAYQSSPEAQARRQAANVPNDTWVTPN